MRSLMPCAGSSLAGRSGVLAGVLGVTCALLCALLLHVCTGCLRSCLVRVCMPVPLPQPQPTARFAHTCACRGHQVALDIAEALDHLHTQLGILHSDLKPKCAHCWRRRCVLLRVCCCCCCCWRHAGVLACRVAAARALWWRIGRALQIPAATSSLHPNVNLSTLQQRAAVCRLASQHFGSGCGTGGGRRRASSDWLQPSLRLT